jgi:hypothetical protein
MAPCAARSRPLPAPSLRRSKVTSKQYREAIAKLGLSQEAAGKWLGVSGRTGQNYAAKGPPEAAAKLIRLMVKLGLDPEEVK